MSVLLVLLRLLLSPRRKQDLLSTSVEHTTKGLFRNRHVKQNERLILLGLASRFPFICVAGTLTVDQWFIQWRDTYKDPLA